MFGVGGLGLLLHGRHFFVAQDSLLAEFLLYEGVLDDDANSNLLTGIVRRGLMLSKIILADILPAANIARIWFFTCVKIRTDFEDLCEISDGSVRHQLSADIRRRKRSLRSGFQ